MSLTPNAPRDTNLEPGAWAAAVLSGGIGATLESLWLLWRHVDAMTKSLYHTLTSHSPMLSISTNPVCGRSSCQTSSHTYGNAQTVRMIGCGKVVALLFWKTR